MRYIIINSNKLFLMAVDFNEYAFTTNPQYAIKFITHEGADFYKNLTKTGKYKDLKVKPLP